ncbi:EsaB/YukD family protein [Rubneribacter sp.]
MNEKVIVSVMLPASRNIYDFRIPKSMRVREASRLVAELLESRERSLFAASPDNALMEHDSGELLDPDSTIGRAGLTNGSRLVLV